MLGIADYFPRPPTEVEGASVKAENLWNEWFTVYSAINLNNVLGNNEATGKQVKSLKRAIEACHTINRLNEAREKQPIRKREERYSRETSKSYYRTTKRVRKVTQNPPIRLLNGILLQANYTSNKTL